MAAMIPIALSSSKRTTMSSTACKFEDDVQFNKGWEVVMSEAESFINPRIRYDQLFIGEILFVDEKTLPNLWRVKLCRDRV
jgi:hypothetical protein